MKGENLADRENIVFKNKKINLAKQNYLRNSEADMFEGVSALFLCEENLEVFR